MLESQISQHPRAGLLAAHGSQVTLDGITYKLHSRETNGVLWADAENLNPRDDHESRYRFTDLLRSESERAAELLAMFEAVGAENLK